MNFYGGHRMISLSLKIRERVCSLQTRELLRSVFSQSGYMDRACENNSNVSKSIYFICPIFSHHYMEEALQYKKQKSFSSWVLCLALNY